VRDVYEDVNGEENLSAGDVLGVVDVVDKAVAVNGDQYRGAMSLISVLRCN